MPPLRCRLRLFFVCSTIVLGCSKSQPATPAPAVPSGIAQRGSGESSGHESGSYSPSYTHLEQGWNNEERGRFYFTTQGSQLIPYDWYLALEQPDNSKRFNDPEFITSLRFIAMAPDNNRNPDGLPIGFVKDDNSQTVLIKLSQIREDTVKEHYPRTNKWLGVTCSLCHTNRIVYKDKSIIIDGAPTLGDVQGFLEALSRSFQATLVDADKMHRFARKVLGSGNNEVEASALKNEVDAWARELQAEVDRDGTGEDPKMRYGFGRLDAFGRILNSVAEVAPRLPQNHTAANAPVSYPFLWDTPMLEWVQWNGAVTNPLGRNVGEVLGAFAKLQLAGAAPEDLFDSSANVESLHSLETQLKGLRAPPWPEDIFGTLDRDKVAAGEKLFEQNCAACHSVRNAQGKFPTAGPNPVGPELIKVLMVPLDKIGTDPTMAMNFVKRRVDPAVLKSRFPGNVIGPDGKVPAAAYLAAIVRAVMERQYKELREKSDNFREREKEIVRELEGNRPVLPRTPQDLMAYKARPLNGIWATAPYLHNGSVPNLYELLLPASARMKKFHVGSVEFKPDRVGFNTEPADRSFEFDTTVPGNSNAGHEGHMYTQTKGSDGQYRDFRDDERLALIEFMKTVD